MLLSFLLCIFTSATIHAADHPTHNMILLGSHEIFASHIVYKEPHNYQIILKINLAGAHKDVYLKARADFPKNLQIFLINPMNLKDIKNVSEISGVLLTEFPDGRRQILSEQITLMLNSFEVVYFDELPLLLKRQ